MAETDSAVSAPIRGLNKDSPTHLLRSGEATDSLNVNLVAHGGALGRRDQFVSDVTATGKTGLIQLMAEWTDSNGVYRIIWKAYGRTKLYAFKPSDNTILELGTCNATDPGNLFVFGTDLYYIDSDNLWHYDTTLRNGVWGTGGATACTFTLTSTSGAMDPGFYRYCLVPYDSLRDIEGRRSPFSAPFEIKPTPQTEYDPVPDRPRWVTDQTQVNGIRPILAPDSISNDEYRPYRTGGIKVEWSGLTISPTGGRYDKIRIYRTAPNTDFSERHDTNGTSFSQLAVLVGEVALGTTSFTDTRGAMDCNWDLDKLWQAGEEPKPCKLALLYGSSIHFFGLKDRLGAYERSVPGRLITVARHFTVTEGGVTHLRSPLIARGGGVCPIPVHTTAVVESQGQTLLFSRSGIYRFAGSSSSPYISELATGFGTAGRWSIAKTPYGIVFWDGAKVMHLNGGLPEPFPTRGVDYLLQAIPRALADSVCVGYCTQTNELLVAYRLSETAGSDQYILAYDFSRSAWFRYRTFEWIYGFFEANVPGKGKQFYAISDGKLLRYPASSGETWSGTGNNGGAYHEVVYGTEDLSTDKTLDSIRVSVGAQRLKFTIRGYWNANNTTKRAEVKVSGIEAPIEMTTDQVNDSVELTQVSKGQFSGRFFTIKIQPVNESTDWSLIDIDNLDITQRKLNG